MSEQYLDHIWKALSDKTRREILNLLREGPKTTTAIVDQFPDLSRFGVMKHLDALRTADLVITQEDGRRRINSLNAAPIRMIYEQWVSGFTDLWADKLYFEQEFEEEPFRISDIRKSTDFGWTKYEE